MANTDAFSWVNVAISLGTAIAGAIAALFAKGFRAGKQESEQIGSYRELETMLTNVIKNQVAGMEQLKKSCETIQELNLRLTKLETQVAERDRYSRSRDPGGYGRFRTNQENEEDDRLFRERGR